MLKKETFLKISVVEKIVIINQVVKLIKCSLVLSSYHAY